MGNLISYVKWRGDLSFEEHPFNEIDNVVLSMLVYLDFECIVPEIGEDEKIKVSDAIDILLAENRTGKTIVGMDKAFILALKESKRFGEILLYNFNDVSDLSGTETDFAAMHMEISPEVVYLGFRGTGNKLIGWQEDFSMTFQIMPAQQMAVNYLDDTFEDGKKYYIGGHSKGGNLAVYASVFAKEEKQNQILQVFSNDGPGFCEEIIPQEKLLRMRDKILRIVPEYCVVGQLFETDAKTIIVKSEINNIGAHDALSWMVEGESFLTSTQLSKGCKVYNEIFNQWIEVAGMEQRMSFTNQLFSALSANGSSTITDLSQGGIDDFLTILISITQTDGTTKDALRKFMQIVFSMVKNINFEKLIREKETLQALILFVVGLFIVLNPMIAIAFAGTTIGLLGVFYMGRRLLRDAFSNQGTIETRKMKTVVQMVIMCLIMYLVAEKSILIALSNLLIAVGFLLFAYYWLTRAFSYKKLFPHRIGGLAICWISFVMGIIPIVLNSFEIKAYMMAAGGCVAMYGVGIIVYNAYKNSKEEFSIT